MKLVLITLAAVLTLSVAAEARGPGRFLGAGVSSGLPGKTIYIPRS